MKSNDRSIFLKILFSYFSVLLIPLSIGVIIYFSAVTSVTKMTRTYSHNMLSQLVSMTDQSLRELNYLPFYYKSNSDILHIMGIDNITEGGPENFEIYKAYTGMPQFHLINSMISNVQILMIDNSYVISQNSAMRWSESTHKVLFPYTDMGYQEFLDVINHRSYNNTFMQFTDSTDKNTSTFLTSITYSNSAQPLATIIIQLKDFALSDMLGNLLVHDGGLALILDENNNLVASSSTDDCTLSIDEAISHAAASNDPSSDYKDYFASNLQSQYNGWKYCVFSPKTSVLFQVSQTQFTMLLLIGFALIISTAFTYLLCRHKSASLKKVLLYLEGSSGESVFSERNEYGYIASAASKLVVGSQQLQGMLEQQKPLLDAAVLRNLLAGDLYRTEEIRHLFSALHIKPENQKFAVLLVRVETSGTELSQNFTDFPALLSVVTQQLIEQHKKSPAYCLDIDSSCKVVILIAENISDEAFSAEIMEFSDAVHQTAIAEHQLFISIYVSDIRNMIDEIPSAYAQVELIARQVAKEKDAYFFSTAEIPEVQKLYYFPVRVELELVQLVKSSSTEALEQLIATIIDENFVKRKLSTAMEQLLLATMRGSILRGIADLPASDDIHDRIKAMDSAVTMEQLSPCILALHRELNRISANLQTEKKARLRKDILWYIGEHYIESEFSIYSLSTEFQMSEAALYQFFREIVGTSLADLIENMRIEKACQLLQERKDSIKVVAMSVGYTNDNSFRRAFKRVMGVTPSEYMGC